MSKKNKRYMKKETNDEAATLQSENKDEVLEKNPSTEAENSEQPRQASDADENGQPNKVDMANENESNDPSEATTEEEKLLAALSEAETKYNDLHDKYLRQMAEFENYRKRTLKEKSEIILNGAANLMTAVLPILDDMDRALDAMAKTDDAESCREGFKLIATKFHTTLEQNGLKLIETKGQTFDTDYHEAIASVPATEEKQKGQVVDCVQKGYKINDKVIRHAKVVVAN